MKSRLSVFYFLQFAVWGCYLTTLGQFLGRAGLGADISWFYAAVGIVSLFMPAFMGHIADRYVAPRRLLTLCHTVAAVFMLCAWIYAVIPGPIDFAPLFMLYLGFLCFFLPTIALANTNAFLIMERGGRDTLKAFPKVRIWGTVGFVAAMWFVNSFYCSGGQCGFTLSDSDTMAPVRLQYTSGQLLASSILGFITALYSLTLPAGSMRKAAKAEKISWIDMLGWRRFSLLRQANIRMFMIFAILTGVCLQISNGFVTPFITHFGALPEYAGNAVAANATMLFSISQIAEAACILLVGISLRRLGIKAVLAVALTAWAIRFATLAAGNPGDGLWLFVISMIAYGVAFDFFNIAGALYIDRVTDSSVKGFGQGVLMLMSNGIGATLGMLGAGAVVNSFCRWQPVMTAAGMQRFFMGDWQSVWWIFAIYAATVALLLILLFRTNPKNQA